MILLVNVLHLTILHYVLDCLPGKELINSVTTGKSVIQPYIKYRMARVIFLVFQIHVVFLFPICCVRCFFTIPN